MDYLGFNCRKNPYDVFVRALELGLFRSILFVFLKKGMLSGTTTRNESYQERQLALHVSHVGLLIVFENDCFVFGKK